MAFISVSSALSRAKSVSQDFPSCIWALLLWWSYPTSCPLLYPDAFFFAFLLALYTTSDGRVKEAKQNLVFVASESIFLGILIV